MLENNRHNVNTVPGQGQTIFWSTNFYLNINIMSIRSLVECLSHKLFYLKAFHL